MSQVARRITEGWAADNLYCPFCGTTHLRQFPNNKAVADFYCSNCMREYELKSKQGKPGKKIADGAYETFVQRITANNNPDFFIMNYNLREACVEGLWIVPKHFFTPSIVEKRKPLASTAKRAGWVGCNILFDAIPQQGKIALIEDKKIIPQQTVLAQANASNQLLVQDLNARGWLFDVLACVNAISHDTFTLQEVYGFEKALALKYPSNHNIRAKIRQQLQFLRDRGILEFTTRGKYKRLF